MPTTFVLRDTTESSSLRFPRNFPGARDDEMAFVTRGQITPSDTPMMVVCYTTVPIHRLCIVGKDARVGTAPCFTRLFGI